MPTAPFPTPRIVRGPTVLLACAGLVSALAGVAGWWMIHEKPVAGAYIDVLALDADYAVAVRAETTSGRAFVELLGLGERLRWQALVPHYQVPDGAVGIAASARAITIRFARDGRTQLFGFAAATAQKLGTIILGDELAKEPDGHLAPGVATLSGGLQSFELLEPDDGPTRVYALSLASGSVMWRRDLPRAGIESAWLTADHLVIEQPGEVSILDRDGGGAERQPSDEVCVVPGDHRGPDRVLVDRAVQAELGPGERFAGQCGERGGTVWIVAQADDATVVQALGRPARITIAGTLAVSPLRTPAPLALPFAGALGPVVPLLVGDRLVGVDLDAARIAWESAASPALRDPVMIDAGTAVLVRAGDLLLSVDPATGAARAVRVPGTLPLRAHHVAGGAVWIVGERGLIVLDARTLAPRGTWASPPAVEPAPDRVSALGLSLPG